MREESLAARIGGAPIEARDLLRFHKKTYPAFWAWSDGAVDTAMLRGSLSATFGWTIQVGADANPRSLRNFPVQANGAEMLRLACIFAVEEGLGLCAPIHDALLLEAPLEVLDRDIERLRQCMARARVPPTQPLHAA